MNLEQISLDISDYWVSTDYLTESNKRCGALVAFDWVDEKISEINTSIDLSNLELNHFEFDTLTDFLNNNNFNFVLGLRSLDFVDNPSEDWTKKLKDNFQNNNIDYDEYKVGMWPTPIPEFDIEENIFILRYSYDEYSRIDKLASNKLLFDKWISKTDFSDLYITQEDILNKYFDNNYVKTRVIVMVSDVGNLILSQGFSK